eukprot:snap_masked-scaffold_5-processed-gene-16.38-mRNA-1 protein AED:1.00 eAED:1.00 QI:0/-1/0/0/-1/1/1/0/311
MLKKSIAIGATSFIGYKMYKLFNPVKVNSFKGKVVLVTGAAAGVGRAFCLLLAKLPAEEKPSKIVIWDIMETGLNETKKLVANISSDIEVIIQKVNLVDKANIYSAAAQTIQVLGDSPDVVVNNAGIVIGKTLLEADDAKIEAEIKINFLAHIWMAKAFLPKMIDSTKSKFHFVNVSSMASYVATAGMSTYAASKYGVRGFWSAMKSEMDNLKLGKKIKISVLCPSHMSTELFEGFDITGNQTMTPEYFASEMIKTVEYDYELRFFPVASRMAIPSIGFSEFLGRLNLPIPAENPMKKWNSSKANSIFAKI